MKKYFTVDPKSFFKNTYLITKYQRNSGVMGVTSYTSNCQMFCLLALSPFDFPRHAVGKQGSISRRLNSWLDVAEERSDHDNGKVNH